MGEWVTYKEYQFMWLTVLEVRKSKNIDPASSEGFLLIL
jgi:hypothetical protein